MASCLRPWVAFRSDRLLHDSLKQMVKLDSPEKEHVDFQNAAEVVLEEGQKSKLFMDETILPLRTLGTTLVHLFKV